MQSFLFQIHRQATVVVPITTEDHIMNNRPTAHEIYDKFGGLVSSKLKDFPAEKSHHAMTQIFDFLFKL